jgi:hypothetical protein
MLRLLTPLVDKNLFPKAAEEILILKATGAWAVHAQALCCAVFRL